MRTGSAYKALTTEEKQFLSQIAMDVAMLVTPTEKMHCFQKQVTEFAYKWNAYKTAYEADRKGKWLPSMGKPSNPMGTIWPIVYKDGWRVWEKYDPKNLMQWYPCIADVRTVLGAYALLAVIHDKILSHCPPIAKGIFPEKLTEEIWGNLVTGVEIEGDSPAIEKDKISRFLMDVKKDLMPELEDNLLQKFPKSRQVIKSSQTKKSSKDGQEDSGGKAGDITSQEWSKPMSKGEMMQALGIDDIKKFNKWAAQYGIKKLGQKTFQIRLDNMDKRSRQKLDRDKI